MVMATVQLRRRIPQLLSQSMLAVVGEDSYCRQQRLSLLDKCGLCHYLHLALVAVGVSSAADETCCAAAAAIHLPLGVLLHLVPHCFHPVKNCKAEVAPAAIQVGFSLTLPIGNCSGRSAALKSCFLEQQSTHLYVCVTLTRRATYGRGFRCFRCLCCFAVAEWVTAVLCINTRSSSQNTSSSDSESRRCSGGKVSGGEVGGGEVGSGLVEEIHGVVSYDGD